MKRTIALSFVCASLAFGQSATQQPTERTQPGVYYKTATQYMKMDQTMMVGGGAKHMGKMLVPGLTPQMVYTFRDAHSPVQVSDAKPTFYVVQNPYMANVPGQSSRDVVIVRFDVKKNHRELQVTSGASALTMKAGFSKERTPDITVTGVSDSAFTVVPTQDLKPGEYLLTFGGSGALGWDFGVPNE